MAEIPDRRGTILRIIVSEYISSAVPVASENIVRGHSLGVSPATARHEMARLEEEGYISRPHTSAGGVPSDKAYRYYVEYLVKEARLARQDQIAIRRFFEEAEQEPEVWARLAVSILTTSLESIAVATLPRAPVCHFRHLDLIALQELLIMLVLVFQEGKIMKRLLAPSQTLSQDELTASANKLSSTFDGLSYRQIGAQEVEMSTIERQISEIVVDMMDTEDRQQHEQFYLDGLRYLVSQSDFVKGGSFRGLVEAIEERSVVSGLLSSLRDASGIRITIGNENQEEALQECSVILSNYGVDERKGTIGVIGPTRMRYGRAIPIVDYVSAVMSDMVSKICARTED